MKILKKRYFAGTVCEQVVWRVADRVSDIKTAEPRPRFKDDAARALHREERARRLHARSFNANFGPTSIYSTLTFEDEYEVHTFEEARAIRDAYARRLLYKYPNAIFRIYMGRGKGTNRIHFHMVSDGIPYEYIKKKWKCGKVLHPRQLREHNYYDGVDHGRDYTGLANYLYNHWTEEQGGRHYKRTKNERKPDSEPAVQVHREYSKKKPPVAPKGYTLVSAKATPYGCLYFKYAKIENDALPKGKKNTAGRWLD